MTSAGSPARASWPGMLVERALALVAADYRRPIGPIVIAAALALAAVAGSGKTAGPFSSGLALSLAVLGTAPIAVMRRYPGPAIAIVLAANAAFIMFGRFSWSAAGVAGWLLALAACPVVLPRRAAVASLALTECAVLLGAADLAANVTPWDATAAEALAAIAAWGAGEMLRARRQAELDKAAAAERLRYLSERDVVARERSGIARELHDVVAHHVSMIAVRAATAPYSVPGLTDPGRAAFAEIADEARSALTELRVVLGVLRSADGGAEAAPQPAIADLGALIDRVAGAGTKATLTMSGQVRTLPASTELCCYRIVQEALTNAGRHAQGSDVVVELDYRPRELSLRVRNSTGHRAAGRDPAGGARTTGSGDRRPAQGFGLTGLRERVSILRGEFRAGPDPGGGFTVHAMLPVPPAQPGAWPGQEDA